jgi:hypothetical protein
VGLITPAHSKRTAANFRRRQIAATLVQRVNLLNPGGRGRVGMHQRLRSKWAGWAGWAGWEAGWAGWAAWGLAEVACIGNSRARWAGWAGWEAGWAGWAAWAAWGLAEVLSSSLNTHTPSSQVHPMVKLEPRIKTEKENQAPTAGHSSTDTVDLINSPRNSSSGCLYVHNRDL